MGTALVIRAVRRLMGADIIAVRLVKISQINIDNNSTKV